jgi:hypothetical protein
MLPANLHPALCYMQQWTEAFWVAKTSRWDMYLKSVLFFFLGGRRGTRTPKHFVNLTGESNNFKML